MRRLFAILAATGALVVVLPAAAQAHITLTNFTVSPSCTTPGGSVTANVSIRQNHWYHLHILWARVQVRQAQTGVIVSRSDEGPQHVPYGSYSSTRTSTVPANAPAGDYRVELLLGSTQGASDWGSATRPLRVRSLAVLCSV